MNEHHTPADLAHEAAMLRARVFELEQRLEQRDAADQQQRYYTQIVESALDAVIAVDAGFRIVAWNPAAVRLYGWQPSEAIGQSIAEMIQDVEYLDGANREIALHMLRRDGVWSGEIIQQDRYGDVVIVDSIVRLIRAADGSTQGMIAINRDVSARKEAELSVRESEAQLRAIFESSQQAIVLIDPSYQIKAFNSYAEVHWRRYGRQMQIGRSMLDYIDPDYRALFESRAQEALRGHPCRTEREVFSAGLGEWWEFSYNPIVLDDGQVTGITWIARNINERVRAEQRSHDSAARLRLLIEQIPAVIWTLDRDARMTSLVGAGLNDAASGESQRRDPAALSEARADWPELTPLAVHQQALVGASAAYEIEWRGRTLQCHVEPFLDGAGATIGTIGIGLDVTERVRAQQLQAGQRRFFEALATGAPLAQALDILALTIEAQMEGGLCSVMLLDEAAQVLRAVAAPSLPPGYLTTAAAVPLGPTSGSCGAAAFDDTPVIVDDIASDDRWSDYRALADSYGLRACWSIPFHDSQGAVLGAFAIYYREPRAPTAIELGYVINAAHLAAVAVERRRTERALRDREELYRLITENSSELIALIDQRGDMLYASPSYSQLLGYEPGELCTRSFFDLVHLDDLPLMLEEWAQLGTRRTIQNTGRLRHADGSWRWIEARGSIIRRGDGMQVVMIGRDITERMRAEAERRRLEDHLVQAQKMESIGTLTGGIAHDFNNVLSVILGNAQLALLESAPDAVERPLLSEIEQAATRGSALTKQLLAFSRRQRLERQVIDLNRTIDDLSLMLTRIIGKDVEIAISLTPAIATVVADPIQIEQVLLNLIVNARDAMPDGGRLEISTRLLELDAALPPYEWAQPGRYVQVVVRDTGVGMTPETQQRVFEPFFTTKAQGKGTGLGLAVVYGIVRQHEGFIHVSSEPGRGTTFILLFPAELSEAVRTTINPLPPVGGGTETILVVEDEASLRRLVRATLEQLGYTVLLAEDGQRGVELFRDNADRIDLVILDLVMPRLGGRDALAQMRRLRPSLRALLVSGYDNTTERLTAEHLPLPPLLTKPYRLDMLGRSVREALDQPAADAAEAGASI